VKKTRQNKKLEPVLIQSKRVLGDFPVMPLDLLPAISIVQPAKLGHDYML
jgi:hypothetical protein